MAWSARSRKTRRCPRALLNGASPRPWPLAPSRKRAVSTLPDPLVRVQGFTRVHLETEPTTATSLSAVDNSTIAHSHPTLGSSGFKVHAGPTLARVPKVHTL